jgi:hypothetical protein
MAVTYERPGSFRIGKVLSDSFAVLGRNMLLLFGLAFIFSGLPALVLQFLSGGATDAAFQNPELMPENIGIVGFVGLITLLLAFVLQAAVVRASVEDMSGKKPAFGDCIGTALAVLLPALGIGVIFFLVMAAGWLLVMASVFILGPLAIVSGIVFLVFAVMIGLRWAVALPVLVQERAGVFGSLRRSSALTAGNRWALFGLFLLLIVVLIIIQVVLTLIIAEFPTIIGALLAMLVSMVMSLVGTIAIAVTYVELRLVKEGTSVADLAKIFA